MADVSEALEVLSGVRRYCVLQADCRDVLPLLSAVDHVVTDPPFSAEVHAKQRRMLRGSGGWTGPGQAAGRGQVGPANLGFSSLSASLMAFCAREFTRLVRKGWIIVKADSDRTGPLWNARLVRAGAKKWGPCHWVKGGAQPNLTGRGPACAVEMLVTCAMGGPGRPAGGKQGAYFEHIATDRNGMAGRFHTTETPVGLWEQVLRDFVRPGQVVLDPFCGSASVGVACLRQGLRYIGIDCDPGDPTRTKCPEPYSLRARQRLDRIAAEVAEHGTDPRRWMRGKQASLL